MYNASGNKSFFFSLKFLFIQYSKTFLEPDMELFFFYSELFPIKIQPASTLFIIIIVFLPVLKLML